MRLPWRRNLPVSRELAEARRRRAEAERQLASEHEHVVIPLRALLHERREKNHVMEAISLLIEDRARRENPGDG
jgi:hypothetical protein